MKTIYKFSEKIPERCFDTKENLFFVQYTCVQTQDQMSNKYNELCLIVALGILSCLFFLVAIRSIGLGNKITITEWDLNIVTLTDYSVEMPINAKGYQNWFDHVFHGQSGDYSKGISPGMSLKRHIIRNVEKTLTKELKAQQEKQANLDEWSIKMNSNILK